MGQCCRLGFNVVQVFGHGLKTLGFNSMLYHKSLMWTWVRQLGPALLRACDIKHYCLLGGALSQPRLPMQCMGSYSMPKKEGLNLKSSESYSVLPGCASLHLGRHLSLFFQTRSTGPSGEGRDRCGEHSPRTWETQIKPPLLPLLPEGTPNNISYLPKEYLNHQDGHCLEVRIYSAPPRQINLPWMESRQIQWTAKKKKKEGGY